MADTPFGLTVPWFFHRVNGTKGSPAGNEGRDSRAAHLVLRLGSLKFPASGLKRVFCAPDGFAEGAVFDFPPALPILAAPV
jgi:hypothetical protein